MRTATANLSEHICFAIGIITPTSFCTSLPQTHLPHKDVRLFSMRGAPIGVVMLLHFFLDITRKPTYCSSPLKPLCYHPCY